MTARVGSTRRTVLAAGALALTAPFVLRTGALRAQAARVRVGTQAAGTVSWEIDTVLHNKLDQKEGVSVVPTEVTDKNPAHVALQAGAVDAIVTDYIFVSRLRAEGADFVFVPHSLAVGGMWARPDANIKTLADMRGKKLGIAGGPVDKSWLLLRAYGQKVLGADMAKVVEPQYGAPPLLNQLILKGDLPAVLNFWQFNARLKARGMQEVVNVKQMLPELGVDHPAPLLGWVFSAKWAEKEQATVKGFLRSSLAAKKILATSDEEWNRLRPRTGAEDDSIFAALREGYRSGIVMTYNDKDVAAAEKVFSIMAALGGKDLTGDSSKLDPGTFSKSLMF